MPVSHGPHTTDRVETELPLLARLLWRSSLIPVPGHFPGLLRNCIETPALDGIGRETRSPHVSGSSKVLRPGGGSCGGPVDPLKTQGEGGGVIMVGVGGLSRFKWRPKAVVCGRGIVY